MKNPILFIESHLLFIIFKLLANFFSPPPTAQVSQIIRDSNGGSVGHQRYDFNSSRIHECITSRGTDGLVFRERPS